VAQGQVVAYVGMTGIATGPHLHYEVMNHDQKLDPKGARVPQAHLDAVIAAAARRADGSVQTARAAPEGPVRSGGGL